MSLSQTEIIWAAGFYDGEGNIGFNKCSTKHYKNSQYYMLDLGIPQVDLESITRFAEAVGVGKIYGPYQRNPKWRPIYAYRARNAKALQVFTLLEPYLCTAKRTQGQTAIAKWQDFRAEWESKKILRTLKDDRAERPLCPTI